MVLQAPAGADGIDGVGIDSTIDNGDGTFTFNYSDGSSFTTIDLTGPQGPAASGNTLDEAYDQGGPGAGRSMTPLKYSAWCGSHSANGNDGFYITGVFNNGLVKLETLEEFLLVQGVECFSTQGSEHFGQDTLLERNGMMLT